MPAASYAQLAWLDGKERRRRGAGAASAPGSTAGVHVGPVLRIHTLPPHGTQLTTLWHEHDDKGDACAGDQSTSRANVLIPSGDDESRKYPNNPNGHSEANGEPNVHGL